MDLAETLTTRDRTAAAACDAWPEACELLKARAFAAGGDRAVLC